MSKLYKMRNGNIVSLVDFTCVKLVKRVKGTHSVGEKFNLLFCERSPDTTLLKINNNIFLVGGCFGSGYDIVAEYAQYIQEELEV